MRKIVFVILVVFTRFSVAGQYNPMLNNSRWVVEILPFLSGDLYYDYIVEGPEVLIGSFSYKKIFDPVYQQDMFFREDILAQKVYQNVEGEDVLAFDFTLETSNEISFDGITYTVSSISSITLLDGISRKVIQLASPIHNETWIEGIGSVNHPLISHRILSEPEVSLKCNFQSNILLYSQTSDCETLSSYDIEIETQIAPNPSPTDIIVKCNVLLNDGKVEIFNSLGQKVGEIKDISGEQFVIPKYGLRGLYFFRLTESNKKVHQNKILFID